MSTHDVPGAVPSHGDELRMGCWAEHEDGSMIFVESTEGGRVVYSIFDLSEDPPVEYRDAMPEKGFKDQFSFKSGSDVKWTWHDKTPFPWERIIKEGFPSGQRFASAGGLLTAAQRVAERLGLRKRPIETERYRHLSPDAERVIEKIQRAISELRI